MTDIILNCVAGLGLVLVIIGYIRKSRNLMLAGVIALVVGLGGNDLAVGFKEGWKSAR